MIEVFFKKFLEDFKKSYFKRITQRFFLYLEKIPEFKGKLDFFKFEEKYFSPYLFVFFFIVFLGFSENPLSLLATFGIFLGIFFYILGLKINFKVPKISKTYFYPFLFLFLISLLGLFYNWSFFVKLSLVFLVLAFLTEHHLYKLSLAVFFFGLFVLKLGFWAIAMPYIFVSLIFIAKQCRRGAFERYLDVITFSLIFFGIFFWVLDIFLAGGIPLINETARRNLNPYFTMLSHMLPVGVVFLISYVKDFKARRTIFLTFVFVALVLMTLLGYRTQVILVILASLIAAFLRGVLTGTETFFGILAGGILGILLTSLRNLVLEAKISIFEALRTRISLSLDIYDMMVSLGGFTGFTHGYVYISSIPSLARLMPRLAFAPRRYIAVFAGMDNVSATSTILGPIALDFGIFGIAIFMFFLGHLLKELWENRKKSVFFTSFYSIVLSYSLIGIETGIVDFEVILLFILAFLYCKAKE